MSAVDVVRKYHEAWTQRDMAAARSCLAHDLDFQGPIDTFSSAGKIATIRLVFDATALRQVMSG
jgi:hypothetical protein